MTSIEQSIVYPEVYFVKIGETSVKVNQEEIVQLIKSAMATDIGKSMLREFLERHNKRIK